MVFERIISDFNMLVVKEESGDFVKSLTVELSTSGLAKFSSLKKGDKLKAEQEQIVRSTFDKLGGTNVWR
jgi:hypothetical protein